MYLIIGASGLIGNKLYRALKKEGAEVKGTYFPDNNNIEKNDAIYLNLENNDFGEIKKLDHVRYLILCHGISNIDRCFIDKEKTYKVNVKNTMKLADIFNADDIIPIFMSTSMVYDGKSERPDETKEPKPGTEYARQKLEMEQYLTARYKKFLILRLTKVFGSEKKDGTLFTGWAEKFKDKIAVTAVDDIFISPIHAIDVVKILSSLIKRGKSGVYNVGGPEALSYYEFACRLARRLGYSEKLVKKSSLNDLKVIEPRNRYNGVNPAKASADSGIEPASYDKYFDLIKNN